MITEKEINENYVDQATAAQILNLSKSRINILCRGGRFDGAFKAGWSWLIPKTAVANFTRLKRGRKRNLDRVIIEHAIAENNKWKELAK